MDWNWIHFILGTCGATAPEIIRLYKIRVKKPDIECPSFYLIISVLFITLGGLIATLLNAQNGTTNPWNAFYIGVTFPTIISAIIGKPPQLSESPQKVKDRIAQISLADEILLGEEDIKERTYRTKLGILEYFGILMQRPH